MAGANFTVATTAVALPAATAKTVLMLRSVANHLVRLNSYTISFAGNAAGDVPVSCFLQKPSTDGTGVTATPVLTNPIASYTIQTGCFQNFSVEPTLGPVLDTFYQSPYGGFIFKSFGEQGILLGASERLCITLTAPDAVNCTVQFTCEE